MRFMIGIAIGAALTLFIATAMDAPTNPVMDRAKIHLESLWDRLIHSTSESLFNAEGLTPPPTEESSVTQAPPALETPPVPEAPPLLAAAEALPEPAFEEILSDPEPWSELPKASARDIPVAALEPPEALPAPLPAGADFRALAPTLPVVLWEPFHSQMSAEGFASRLSEELDHQFRVERQGAGSYQVVFDARSDSERELLLAQIAEITGR